METHKLVWNALEHNQPPRSSDWYWIVSAVAIATLILCIFFGNLLFGAIVVLGLFSAAVYARHGAATLYCELNTKGVIVERKFFPYKHLQSFGIVLNSLTPKIVFRPRKTFAPLLCVPLGDMNEEIVRSYLLSRGMKEDEYTESFLQHLLEYFGL